MSRLARLQLFVWFLAAITCAWADDGDRTEVFFQRAEQAYQAARVRYHREPTNVEAAWQFGRACVDRADVAKHDKERGALAQEGVLACRQAVIDDPKSPYAHYYLGVALGELASSRGLGALRDLREMEEEWTTAVRLDPTIDYGGPNRCLGLLFTQAPGWPLSVGSRTKAIQNLNEAVRVNPGFPDNLLSLTEAHLKWNEWSEARGVAAKLPDVMSQARKELTGPTWESSWIDWDRRWDAIKARLNESSHAPSPHAAH